MQFPSSPLIRLPSLYTYLYQSLTFASSRIASTPAALEAVPTTVALRGEAWRNGWQGAMWLPTERPLWHLGVMVDVYVLIGTCSNPKKDQKSFAPISVRRYFSILSTFLGLLQISRKPRIDYRSRIAISSKYGTLSGGFGTVEQIQNWLDLRVRNYLRLDNSSSSGRIPSCGLQAASTQASTTDRQWFCMDTPSKCPHFKIHSIFESSLLMGQSNVVSCLEESAFQWNRRSTEVVDADWGSTRAACIILRHNSTFTDTEFDCTYYINRLVAITALSNESLEHIMIEYLRQFRSHSSCLMISITTASSSLVSTGT